MDTPAPASNKASRDAWLLREVIEATAPAGERDAAARERAGVIEHMFRDFAPATTLEAMTACQCIATRFLAMAAMRVLAGLTDEKLLARARAQANALSKTHASWLRQYDRMRARAVKAARAGTGAPPPDAGLALPAASAASAAKAVPPPVIPADVPTPGAATAGRLAAPEAVRRSTAPAHETGRSPMITPSLRAMAAAFPAGQGQEGRMGAVSLPLSTRP